MKRIILSAGLIFLLTVSVFAQQNRRGERPDAETRAKMMTERMAEQLGLSEEQKAKILTINLEKAKKQTTKMEARKADREAKKAGMQETYKQIKEVLTEEQRQKWEELKESHGKRGPRGGMIEDREEFRKRRGGGNN